MIWKWNDDADVPGYSDLQVGLDDPTLQLGASVWSPIDPAGKPRKRNWEVAFAARRAGLNLSMESAKTEAAQALRQDAERIVAALGGKVVWE